MQIFVVDSIKSIESQTLFALEVGTALLCCSNPIVKSSDCFNLLITGVNTAGVTAESRGAVLSINCPPSMFFRMICTPAGTLSVHFKANQATSPLLLLESLSLGPFEAPKRWRKEIFFLVIYNRSEKFIVPRSYCEKFPSLRSFTKFIKMIQ